MHAGVKTVMTITLANAKTLLPYNMSRRSRFTLCFMDLQPIISKSSFPWRKH